MSEYIATAFSSHKRCLICRSNRVRLHLVKEYSIKLAYRKYNIYIKKDSRLCDDHLDSNGYIKEEEFNRIPTEMHRYDKMTKKYIEAFSKDENVFDKFKCIDTLEEKHCFSITRWTKSQFMRFSLFITSVYTTKGRSKEELIALYRYWLFRGLDQISLSFLKSNSSQQMISFYLDSIRRAKSYEFICF